MEDLREVAKMEKIYVSAKEWQFDVKRTSCNRTLRRLHWIFYLGDYKLSQALAGEFVEAEGYMTHCDFENLGYDHIRIGLSNIHIVNPGEMHCDDMWEIEGEDAWMSLEYREYQPGPRGERGEHIVKPYATADCAVYVKRRILTMRDGTKVITVGPDWMLSGTVPINIY